MTPVALKSEGYDRCTNITTRQSVSVTFGYPLVCQVDGGAGRTVSEDAASEELTG